MGFLATFYGAALKFGVQASAAHHHRSTALPCKFSGVSGQLRFGRSKRFGLSATSGPAMPSPTAFEVKGSALKRRILSLVPVWHDRPVMLQVALGALAVFHLRPSDYTPVLEVNVLWALEGNSSIRAHGGVLVTYHGFSWRKFERRLLFIGSSQD